MTKETKKQRHKRLKRHFSTKEIAGFEDLKANGLNGIPGCKEFNELMSKGEGPEYFYDSKHNMLYKKISEGSYKHVA